MINLKTTRELRYMRDAGKISQEALLKAGEAVRPGVSTLELDKIVRRTIEKAGAVPSFLGYGGFPASACISVNNVVIHGIPSAHEILKEGDIVSIDVGAIYEGFNGDNAWTFPCGKVSEEAQKLMDATRESLFLAIEKAVPMFAALCRATASAISAPQCSSMSKLAITRWYGNLSATA